MNTKGYVYFIQCGEYYKIGSTIDVYSRFHTIQVTNPTDVSIFHVVKTDNMRLTEKLFQSMFERVEIRGEWFKLSEKNLEHIKSGEYSKHIIESIGAANDPLTMPDLIAM